MNVDTVACRRRRCGAEPTPLDVLTSPIGGRYRAGICEWKVGLIGNVKARRERGQKKAPVLGRYGRQAKGLGLRRRSRDTPRLVR